MSKSYMVATSTAVGKSFGPTYQQDDVNFISFAGTPQSGASKILGHKNAESTEICSSSIAAQHVKRSTGSV